MITKEQIKNTGATFTPKELAVFLAERIASYAQPKNNRVLDPACGEGELLIAMGEVLNEKAFDFSLTGYDANEQYLSFAKDRLFSFGKDKSDLVHEDFLLSVDMSSAQNTPSLFDECTSSVNNSFDIVIANPPYVRTQILGTEKAQNLARKFNLKGRVDLYYPFLIAMTESLKEGGLLGVITSNRYLSTKSGESVRKYLSENYEILELIDLGDTKLFEAAVLPAIFIGKKKKQKSASSANFIKIYEELNGYKGDLISVESVYDVLKNNHSGYFVTTNGKRYKKSSGALKYKIGSTTCWEMLSNNESGWIAKIDKATKNRVEDFFKVKVGIKSTADKVFISDKWEELNGTKPEDELLKELISQENIEPWNATDNFELKVLYPHISVNGEKQTVNIEKYPKAKKYFTQHEEKLKGRKYLIDAGRQWFELWVPHRPDQWKYPKLVFPDISLKPRFYFDNGGKIVNGNCYWIVATKESDVEKLFLIQGVANSKLMTKYHDLVFNNKLYSGRRRYFTQYVEKYPLPDFNSEIAKEIIVIVKELNHSNDKTVISDLENQLEIAVAKSFGVEPVFTLD
ncbi:MULTISPECIES: Eco57I restriction-modification methylase domain-containing protein [Flavobacterium]|uniref:site-specific DNA-methyltransferase (adenine-specific) n=1 Tax=Flavobacterium columnare TaxID=996 RepID=A0AA94JN28_9FLAO|nr:MULTISPECIES: N-6 DNA methylase [Flavobacterium]MCH4828766.1 N-6 DNA methylase [Flavobacterium columnare]MCH4832020.1 N-6 DNA methylase [Flavobacterium columnare]QYS90417.1 N-6 DNA methylase [Flavobacterium covae]